MKYNFCRVSLYFSVLLLFCFTMNLRAQRRAECYVIRSDGSKLQGRELSVDSKGVLTLIVDDKMRMPFSPGSYKHGFVPKPKEVEELEKLYEEKKFAELAAKAPQVFEKYKLLGWCNVIAALHAEALLQENKSADARKVIASAARMSGEFRESLDAAIVKLYIADKEYDKAEAILRRQLRSAEDQAAAQAFLLMGELAEAKNDKKQAVLEYLKVMMLFEGRRVKDEKALAKSRATKLMREMRDPRVDKITAYE